MFERLHHGLVNFRGQAWVLNGGRRMADFDVHSHVPEFPHCIHYALVYFLFSHGSIIAYSKKYGKSPIDGVDKENRL